MTQDLDSLPKDNNRTNTTTSTSTTRRSSAASSKTSSSTANSANNKEKRDKNRDAIQTRVVVRHLPPTMTEEQFLEQISPLAEHNNFYFVRADPTLGQHSFCRAYINFVHQEDLFIFKDKFDSYVFLDARGNEYSAIVEFAPFQKIPRRRIGPNGGPIPAKKRDNKCATIEQDPEYMAFIEELQTSKTESNLPSADIYLEEIEAREKELKANHGVLKVTTPLIEFIKQKKAEKLKLREERREERKRQQQEQKRLREEEHQRKLKEKQLTLQKKQEEIKKHKDFEDRLREKVKKDTEKDRPKNRDADKKDSSKSTKESNKKVDFKKSEKSSRSSGFSNRYKSDKKDANESTFVVKVLQHQDKDNANDSTSKSEEKKSDSSQQKHDKKQGENSQESNTEASESRVTSETPTNEFAEDAEGGKSDSKRIRNKDRPAREIYRPGSKRTNSSHSQSNNNEATTSSSHKSSSSNKSEHGYKNRVFTRSKHAES